MCLSRESLECRLASRCPSLLVRLMKLVVRRIDEVSNERRVLKICAIENWSRKSEHISTLFIFVPISNFPASSSQQQTRLSELTHCFRRGISIDVVANENKSEETRLFVFFSLSVTCSSKIEFGIKHVAIGVENRSLFPCDTPSESGFRLWLRNLAPIFDPVCLHHESHSALYR